MSSEVTEPERLSEGGQRMRSGRKVGMAALPLLVFLCPCLSESLGDETGRNRSP